MKLSEMLKDTLPLQAGETEEQFAARVERLEVERTLRQERMAAEAQEAERARLAKIEADRIQAREEEERVKKAVLAAAERKMLRDKAHRAKVIATAVAHIAAQVNVGDGAEHIARQIIAAIAAGKIPAVTISFL